MFLLELLFKLGLVLLLIYGSLYLLRRYVAHLPQLSGKLSAADRPLQIVQVQAINRQVTLYLLEVEQPPEARRLLISVSGQQVELLSEWQASPLQPETDAPSSKEIV